MLKNEFTNEEKKAIKVLVEFAAARCGGGEDIIGAILYTGASKYLVNNDEAVVTLATKLNNC